MINLKMWPAEPKYGFCAAREATFLFNVKTFEFDTPGLKYIIIWIANRRQSEIKTFYTLQTFSTPEHKEKSSDPETIEEENKKKKMKKSAASANENFKEIMTEQGKKIRIHLTPNFP